jgi:hypothetical protein
VSSTRCHAGVRRDVSPLVGAGHKLIAVERIDLVGRCQPRQARLPPASLSGVQADSPPPPLSAGRKVSLTYGNTNYTLVIVACRFASFCGLVRPGCGLVPDTHVRFAPALRGQRSSDGRRAREEFLDSATGAVEVRDAYLASLPRVSQPFFILAPGRKCIRSRGRPGRRTDAEEVSVDGTSGASGRRVVRVGCCGYGPHLAREGCLGRWNRR